MATFRDKLLVGLGFIQHGPVSSIGPRREKGRVIIHAAGKGGFAASGKVDPKVFFPGFCEILQKVGLRTYFTTTPQDLARRVTDKSCTIHIYNEDREEPVELPVDSPLVFNCFLTGRLIRRKDLTNQAMTKAGIQMPRIVADPSTKGRLFVNNLAGSGSEVSQAYDSSRYNTEFIDTRVPYRGMDYHTSLRLRAVGGRLLHVSTRCRPSGGSPAVHLRDTPLDPDLLEHLHATLVAPRMEAFHALAARIGKALGPGFYGHDVLISSDTGEMLLCEVNFKFDARHFATHMRDIADKLPSQQMLFHNRLAAPSAKAFLSECHDHGLFRDVVFAEQGGMAQLTDSLRGADARVSADLTNPAR